MNENCQSLVAGTCDVIWYNPTGHPTQSSLIRVEIGEFDNSIARIIFQRKLGPENSCDLSSEVESEAEGGAVSLQLSLSSF
jgi:hypothetical protein